MAFEKECDIVLFEISEAQENDGGFAINGINYEELSHFRKNVATDVIKNYWGTITSILIVDGFVERIPNTRNYRITINGIAFLATDTFVDRKKRWDLENKTKLFAYRNRRVTWFISCLALIVSIASYLKPSKTQVKILPIQEKKYPEELKIKEQSHKVQSDTYKSIANPK